MGSIINKVVGMFSEECLPGFLYQSESWLNTLAQLDLSALLQGKGVLLGLPLKWFHPKACSPWDLGKGIVFWAEGTIWALMQEGQLEPAVPPLGRSFVIG